jgi:uncharacterized protein YcbX
MRGRKLKILKTSNFNRKNWPEQKQENQRSKDHKMIFSATFLASPFHMKASPKSSYRRHQLIQGENTVWNHLVSLREIDRKIHESLDWRRRRSNCVRVWIEGENKFNGRTEHEKELRVGLYWRTEHEKQWSLSLCVGLYWRSNKCEWRVW